MRKIIIGELGFIAIILLIVLSSGCVDNTENNTTKSKVSSLENDIAVENVTIKPAEYGNGYDAVLTVTYKGTKPINGRLGIEPVPMYGNTEGESELGNYKSLPNGIQSGQSYKIELNDIGGFVDNISGITGIKFCIGAEYQAVDSIYSPSDVFYTQVYPVMNSTS